MNHKTLKLFSNGVQPITTKANGHQVITYFQYILYCYKNTITTNHYCLCEEINVKKMLLHRKHSRDR